MGSVLLYLLYTVSRLLIRAEFYVVTENSLYILNGVVHTAVKETIPFAKWSLTRG